MKRLELAAGRRFAALAVAGVLALCLAGDRGRAATVPAAVWGQDPLEVLELKVRPNVIIVLDTSGSMTSTTTEESDTRSGDHPRSKLWQGKQVLKQTVQQNQDKVSFQMGTYTQNGFTLNNSNASTTGNRFQYVASTMPATPSTGLLVRGARSDTLGRGLQSWQIIQPAWNRLWFGDAGGAICYAEIQATPRFYNSGAALATDLQDGMNGVTTNPNVKRTCTTGTPSSNTYRVTYSTGGGTFTFHRQSGSTNFNIRWADTPSSIRGALGRRSTNNTTPNSSDVTSGSPYRLLYRADSGGSGGEMGTEFTLNETIAGTDTTFYQAAAGRLWNGEVIRVDDNGTVCGMTFPAAAQMTNPPSFTLQLVADGCGADTAGSSATFSFGGGSWNRSGDGCRGFRSKSSLVPCDLQSPPAPTQFSLVDPYLEGELPFDSTGKPADLTTNGAAYNTANYSVPDGIPDYLEYQDGSFQVQSLDVGPAGKAAGYTPIANSLIDIKGTANASDNTCVTTAAPSPGKLDSVSVATTTGQCVERGFTKLWSSGQAGSTTMAGPAPWQISPIQNHGVCPDGSSTCASALRKPKEKTIVIFVTDGDDTCYARGDGHDDNGDPNARRAAIAAEDLYTPLVAGDSASSVQTYVIGYGGGTPKRLDWIAWGGSGLGQDKDGQPDVDWTDDSDAELRTARSRCKTCVDAYIAPTAAVLATQLQSIIDQGASEGDFNAQQSVTDSIFEYVDLASYSKTDFDARVAVRDTRGTPNKGARYDAIVPTQFISSFTLPNFKGQLKAYHNDGAGNAVEEWSAGDKLWNQVSTAMSTCNTETAGGAANQCTLLQLHGGATEANIGTSTAKIKRRIYTTDRNGVYTFTPATLMAQTANSRVTLWPPPTTVAPTDYTSVGSLDSYLGLPPNTPTAFPPNPIDAYCDAASSATPKRAYNRCWFDWLKSKLGACAGSNLPTACTSGSNYTPKMQAARREARDIILAFMAGAETVPDTTGIKRTSAAVGSSPSRSLLFKARSWILADSELATVGVVTQPNVNEPGATSYTSEYKLYRDGVRDGSTPPKNPDTAGTQIKQGFGLTLPDTDADKGVADSRLALKPVMSVVYAPANDMLHAFRAGPCYSPSTSPANCNGGSAAEGGGEELWGFVPFDQLGALLLRVTNDPQGRNNHVYMLTRGVRFADVFVPSATLMTNVNIGGVTVASMQGVWRRVLYFGRGIGGKYVTALDVTAPGPYTAPALSTTGPIPLWSRGNPDSQTGLASGTDNNTLDSADRGKYAKMGETWSIPTVAFVKEKTVYSTTRRPGGNEFVIFMGSGYGATGEGTTHYALDALSGDVIAAADVEQAALDAGLPARSLSYRNALVANSVSFNRSRWGVCYTDTSTTAFASSNAWCNASERVYIGDIYGRVWKFLSSRPDLPIPVADLGADQPVGSAVALLHQTSDDSIDIGPYIFLSSGADKRASGPFRSFAFSDNGSASATTTTGSTVTDGVTAYAPVQLNFVRTYDQGDPDANCGYATEAVFRGTVQPTSNYMAGEDGAPSKDGVVFFAGTRLSPPNTKFAPPTPLACGAGYVYPCRSQFDSILYALQVATGNPAYDLNSGTEDAYRIYRDSRIAAISIQADPLAGGGGSRLAVDEGLIKSVPKPPPPPGVPPQGTTSASGAVVLARVPGQPAPAVQWGSTVCQ